MGSIVEVWHDDRGIIWPKSVAPFAVCLVSLGSKDADVAGRVSQSASDLHDELAKAGVEVLWDDRVGVSAGEKFADADLLGMPLRLVVSEKTLAQESVEWKERSCPDSRLISQADILESIQSFLAL